MQLQPSEYNAFLNDYISRVDSKPLQIALLESGNSLLDLLEKISEKDSLFRYAPGKWSLREMLQHIIDTDRIFTYRALCISRGETQSLPGFDENQYALMSNADYKSWDLLLNEYKTHRRSAELFFEGLTNDQLISSGFANNRPVSVRALGYAIAGHTHHHMSVIEENYLPGLNSQ